MRVTRIGTPLEVDFRSLATHFGFGCPYKSLVGDNLAIALATEHKNKTELRLS